LISFADIRGQSLELFKIARTVDFEWVHIGQQNFAVSGQTFTAQTGKGSEIGPNLACFAPPPHFLGGGQAFKFLDRHYKLEHASDHLAKFRGDRPTNLKDLALKKFFKKLL